MVKKLYIAMNNILVGEWLHSSTGKESFKYFDSWIENPNSRGISLTMPVRKVEYSNDIVKSFFSNLIPERKEVIELIQKKYKIKQNDTFSILTEIGRDCIGAIQIAESPELLTEPQTIQGEKITEAEIASILRNSQLNIHHTFNNKDDIFRISLAGAQKKTAFLYHEDSWKIPIGSTPTTHIFKLPIGNINDQIKLTDSIENEWYCSNFFKNMGLPVASSEILTFEDQKTLSVKRFDRVIFSKKNKIIRLPQEDFCQVLNYPSQLKYQNENGPGAKEIITILKQSNNFEDQNNFFKALLLNWLIAGTDAHAKNYSIFIKKNNAFELTPFYDIMSFSPYLGNKQNQIHKSNIKLAMAVRGSNGNKYKIDDITKENWIKTGTYLKLQQKNYQRIIDEIIEQVPKALEKTNNNLPSNFPTYIADSITLVANNYLNRLK